MQGSPGYHFGAPPPFPVSPPGFGQSQTSVKRSLFTIKNFIRNGLIISALFFVNKAGMPGNVIFMLIACFMAVRSSEGALKAFSLTMLVTIGNQAFVTPTAVFSAGRFVILFLAAARYFHDLTLIRKNFFSRGYVWSLMLFVIISGMLSLVTGYFVTISLLKLFAFAIGAFAILLGTEAVRFRSSEVTCWFVSIISFCVLLGVVAYVTGVGYGMETVFGGQESLFFKGPFFHSQALGAVGALMLVYLYCVLLFTPYGLKWLTTSLIVGMAVLIYLTGSRTGLGTAVIGCASTTLLAFVIQPKRERRLRMNIKKSKLIGLAFLGAIMLIVVDLLTGGTITGTLFSFLNKYNRSNSSGFSFEALIQGRLGLIQMGWHNFLQNPWTGIGFGTSYDPYFVASATWFSAPTEKGFLPVAILEETGILGATIFWVFVISLIVYLIRDRNVSGFGMFITLLAANLGEMMFFSFGGQGGMAWTLLGAGLVLGDRCMVRVMPPR